MANIPAAPAVAPAIVKAETGIDRIRLNFAAFDEADAAQTGGSQILSYHLQRTEALGSLLASQVANGFSDAGGAAQNVSLSTEYTILGLQRGQAYGFRYRAVNINGPGRWSPISFITAATVPDPPAAAPEYVSSTDEQVMLKLSRSFNDGGSAITDYELQRDQGSSTSDLLASGTSSYTTITAYSFATHGFSFTVEAAALGAPPTAGLLYRFRWRAKNYMGDSAWSDTSRFGLGALPAVPAGLARRTDVAGETPWNSRTSIGLTWNLVTGALPVTDYLLYIRDDLEADWRLAYRGPLQSVKIEGLTPGAVYTFKVSAANYNGEGAESSAAPLRSCVAPSGVSPPKLVGSTESTVTLRWEQPLDDGGCAVSGYRLYRDDGVGGAIETAVAFNAGLPAEVIAEPHVFEHLVTLGLPFSGVIVRFNL